MIVTALVATMMMAPAALLPGENPWLFALPLVLALALAGRYMWRWANDIPTLRVCTVRQSLLGIRASWAAVWARAPP